MKNLATIREEIKAGAKYSAMAQLVAVYIENGITSTAEIAKATGKSERQIWRAKADIRVTDTDDTLTHTSVSHTSATLTPASHHTDAGVSNQRTDSRARAYKEYPSGIVNLEASKLASSTREIEGLNGSTGKWVNKLAVWLAGDLGFPDEDSAFRILESTVEAYGATQVRVGMLELETEIASGNKPRNLAKAFSGFVKNAKTGPRPQPKKPQTLWEILQAEEAAKASAGGVQ